MLSRWSSFTLINRMVWSWVPGPDMFWVDEIQPGKRSFLLSVRTSLVEGDVFLEDHIGAVHLAVCRGV
jgi:hypothetical protein